VTDRIEDAKTIFCLRQGDACLVLGQRLAEWCGHGPALELDLSLSNLALDQIGQARLFLQYAGELEGKGRDEDMLAYGRDAFDYRNVLLVEQPNGDFGRTVLRQFLFAAYQRRLYDALSASADKRLAAIAQKSLKEAQYHERFSRDWVIRLGAGTEESHDRMQQALEALWRFVGELFERDDVETALVAEGVLPDMADAEESWRADMQATFAQAGLTPPDVRRGVAGGRAGRHTEHLGRLLSDLQFLQRAYPGAQW